LLPLLLLPLLKLPLLLEKGALGGARRGEQRVERARVREALGLRGRGRERGLLALAPGPLGRRREGQRRREGPLRRAGIASGGGGRRGAGSGSDDGGDGGGDRRGVALEQALGARLRVF
jgi:hypothetical protein